MAMMVKEIRAWLAELADGAEVGIDEGGLALRVVGDEDNYLEIGALPWDEGPVTAERMVTVRFTPQAWVKDTAIECDAVGPREFLVPEADAKVEGAWMQDRSAASDTLKNHRNAPRWIHGWSGPFDIEILHEP